LCNLIGSFSLSPEPSPSLPYKEVLQAIKYFFNQPPIKKPNSETLLRLAELVLTLNCFSFGDNYDKQINSVAMGTKMETARPTSSLAISKVNLSPTTTDQNLIVTNVASMTALALLHPAEKNSTNLLPHSILFTRP